MYTSYTFVSEIDNMGAQSACQPGNAGAFTSNFIVGLVRGFQKCQAQGVPIDCNLDNDMAATYPGTGSGSRGNLDDNPNTWQLAGNTIYRLLASVKVMQHSGQKGGKVGLFDATA